MPLIFVDCVPHQGRYDEALPLAREAVEASQHLLLHSHSHREELRHLHEALETLTTARYDSSVRVTAPSSETLATALAPPAPPAPPPARRHAWRGASMLMLDVPHVLVVDEADANWSPSMVLLASWPPPGLSFTHEAWAQRSIAMG